MKNLAVIFFLLTTINVSSQSKKELKAQISALKKDTTALGEENRELKKELVTVNETLNKIDWELNNEKGQVDFWKYQKQKTEDKLNSEINQLAYILQRSLTKSTATNSSKRIVYFGDKDEFHGYDYVEGGVVGPPDYIAIPFGVDRTLINVPDLSDFSLSYRMSVFYKIEINANGDVLRLWCDEKKSHVKNQELLRMIGEEIQKQAKYSKVEATGHFFENNRLVELEIIIPRTPPIQN